MAALHGPAPEDVTIGVIGADKFVHRIAAVAREETRTPHRLLTAVYERESDAREKAMRIVGDVDVLLFAGPLPYDVAMSGGPLPVPATFVPTGGVALPTALLRGSLSGTVDPARVSIDSALERDVRETYAELGVDMRHVHVMEYHESVAPEQFLAFHRDLFHAGRTSGAITTVPSVAAALADAEIPSLTMAPAAISLRNALRTARLLGSGARLEDSRIAIVIARLPASALPHRTSSSNYWYQELKLSLHRALLHDARRMDAAVLQRDEHSYLVITTMGSLRSGTDDLTRAPFLASVRDALGIDAEVGIGLGRTTLEAEENAQSAVNLAVESGGDLAYLVGPQGSPIALPASHDGEAPEPAPVADRQNDTLREIITLLDGQGDEGRVVDAERVSQLQGVTLRTARRTLRSLVDAGLAWPMPPARVQKVGRPPVRYQLLDERLTG
ncbi:conserved hypothetical protein [Beutenbergia cavernae DSM 12333]|uniref:Transcriptional regulator n=1 Tax=Beutenbergia cavernae (strain ATCC BAA-8 / DSM 12333 / CCUG 43141 / JCM 11478 / NBRC 16432 / NCIMB 13614 / HKI 0122) TaxID=471853 RepID=C5C1H0_BEUC1|nr:hypothetical protein [Beutenbergia cavernae]ACQ81580.1 conserved hypothetical protein [Beutenbergia cavernae DSM 12333]